MAELRTRPPTGRIAFPLVLVEGQPKTGKTYCALDLAASEKVGRVFLFDMGEGTGDEYANLGEYEIVEHNGTWTDFYAQVVAATSEPSEPEKPNVVIIDSVSQVWILLSQWAEMRARNSRSNRQKLASDPDADVDVGMSYWNDAKDRWRSLMNRLVLFPGIAVVTARGSEVAKVVNGQPVAGQTEYSVQGEKTLTFDATAWVRMTAGHRATLIAARSLFVDVPAKGVDLGTGRGVLDRLVFDVLRGGGEFQVPARVTPQVGVSAALAKTRLMEAVQQHANPDDDQAKVRERAAELWKAAGLDGQDEVTQDDLDLVCRMAAPADRRAE